MSELPEADPATEPKSRSPGFRLSVFLATIIAVQLIAVIVFKVGAGAAAYVLYFGSPLIVAIVIVIQWRVLRTTGLSMVMLALVAVWGGTLLGIPLSICCFPGGGIDPDTVMLIRLLGVLAIVVFGIQSAWYKAKALQLWSLALLLLVVIELLWSLNFGEYRGP